MGNKGNNKILELIHQADWDAIYPRAIKFALSRLSFRSGTTQAGTPKIDEAECIVQEAIKKIIEGSIDKDRNAPKKGSRKWNPERGDLSNYLLYVVKSDISHLYKLDDYKLTSRMPAPNNDDSEPVESEELLKKAHAHDKHATDITPDDPQSVDNAIIEQETCNSLLKVVEGDDELENIVLCMTYGFSKPRDIAEQLGVKVEIIYNANKRLKRAFQGLLQAQNKETI